jgi:FKBP-type peptidyl-prolyl cis-trans isomerase
MRIFLMIIIVGLTITSCDIEGVKTSDEKEKQAAENDALVEEMKSDSLSQQKEIVIDKASDTLKLNNGITITYFKKGKGEKLKKGDVVMIDYRAKLEDGTIYDGNHKVKKPSIPFLVGWNQQTSGWDIALQELRVGDDVDIFLPAKFARGKNGIKGIVPPNANNILSMRIVEKFKPTATVDGVKIWKYDELKTPGDSIQPKDDVLINYWVSSESKPRYDNSYQRGEPFKLKIGDKNIVPGLHKALISAREGDRLMVFIPAKEAYGNDGLIEMVKPGEDIFYDVQVAKVE